MLFAALHMSLIGTERPRKSRRSCHRKKAAAFHWTSGSSRCRLIRVKWRWPTPFAPRALLRFIANTKQSAPNRRIGTFGLAV